MTRYGITRSRYDELLLNQGGRCSICRSPSPNSGHGNRYFDVDHCHTTGAVRGLLCRQCNVLLGHLERLKDARLLSAVRSYLNVHLEYDPKG